MHRNVLVRSTETYVVLTTQLVPNGLPQLTRFQNTGTESETTAKRAEAEQFAFLCAR